MAKGGMLQIWQKNKIQEFSVLSCPLLTYITFVLLTIPESGEFGVPKGGMLHSFLFFHTKQTYVTLMSFYLANGCKLHDLLFLLCQKAVSYNLNIFSLLSRA